MDPWKTAPFELGHGDDACLLLHGFTGSPWDIRPLGEALAARGLHVKAPRLPGHGTTPEALLEVSHRHWQESAQEALYSLRGYRNVFVAGLSMGALLGLHLAARQPELVRGLVLIAPAARFKGPTMALLKRLRHTGLLERVKPWVHKTGTDLSDPVALAEAPILSAFPSARLNDLWTLQAQAVENAPLVRCPTLVVVAEQDHVVDPEGGRWLASQLTQSPDVRVLSLHEGYHIIPRDKGGPRMAAEVGDFLEPLREWGIEARAVH
ncbi:alpha/beta hydrolase [Hyalangium rubrum]|uniref:Alpha/beta fold hydrolase n=1 Tax=Hyalangium rubrum TaxID=3103134 RepID=A0ABU5H4H7_9BACT|nr:alpha/beta fold hydrolase [Hyalangium sp. s54d21]MDY7227789.1 alpha/beta fold hydrolase [Hyalangium sp. s54d21]